MVGSNSKSRIAPTVWLVLGTAAVAILATLGVLFSVGALASQSRQEEVAERGTSVMPFDLDNTTHIFEPTENGGVQQVVADDPSDEEQISLVRAHLRQEADNFSQGDFSNPKEIHGEEMPGLKELEAGASNINIRYSEVPTGARIDYTTEDPALVAAIHRWFEAQLYDHGKHAAERHQHTSTG